jgi:hypothetical protein
MAMDDFRKEALKQALEKRRRLEEAGVNLTRATATDSAVEEAKNRALATQQHVADLTSPRVNIKPLLEAIEAVRRPLPAGLLRRKSEIDEFLRTFSLTVLAVRNAVEMAVVPLARSLERWQQANRELEELIWRSTAENPLVALARGVTAAYEANATAVARRIQELNLNDAYPSLGMMLTVPTVRYVDFGRRTINRISESDDPRERAALGGSLVIAQEQVAGSTSLIEEVTAGLVGSAESSPVGRPTDTRFNAYDAAQDDLLVLDEVPDAADYRLLWSMSPAARVTEQARALVQAVIRCNKNSQLRGGEDIFKLTNTFTDACVALTGLIVRNEDDLRNLIYYLYMIFYEGAGKDKLRYIERGLVTDADCGVIWTLKGLRNKWHEHDPEHGDEGKIRANYRKLSEALRDLGFSFFPRAPGEFTEIQRKLISGLASLVAKMESATGTTA